MYIIVLLKDEKSIAHGTWREVSSLRLHAPWGSCVSSACSSAWYTKGAQKIFVKEINTKHSVRVSYYSHY